MGYHQQFHRAAIERGIPEDEVSKFAEFLRFVISASGVPNGVPVGRSGGLPRLPVGMEWPSSEGGGPLPFLASFDCATLPRVDGLALPADGSLLFFLHHEEDHDAPDGGFARVMYVPAGTDTATAESPVDDDEQMFYNAALDFVGEEYDLFAEVSPELPSWFQDDELFQDDDEASQSDDLEHLGLNLAHREELWALARELWPGGGGAISLGGYCMNIGATATDHMYDTPETDMAYGILAAREKAGELVGPPDEWDLRLEKETLRVMREWVPLAQFYPDDYYYGRFLIRHDDLAAGRFDKALSFTAFTE
ncbi:DUF1963 domain-containing protein [Streptomyces sp. CL12]|uniref:DUF1963 domain-containing protein n=1 Tax=Streptomyces sp. CL12 TaxID=3391744 RepID=UPI003A8047E3